MEAGFDRGTEGIKQLTEAENLNEAIVITVL
jgi:hypothetical protein